MTALKNGIKSTVRTPLKTILFSMVLVFLSVLLTVSLSVFAAVRAYLRDCDDYYHTIAKLEFLGSDYPDASVYDPALADAVTENDEALTALQQTDGVISYEADSNAAAVVTGMHRWDSFVYAPDRAVLRLTMPIYDERLNNYMMIVSETLYSRKNYTNKLIIVRSDTALFAGAERLQSGKAYYMVGSFFRGQSSNPWFYAETITYRDGDQTVTLPAVWEADEDESLREAYARYAEQLRLMNDCCRVQITASLEDEPRFQQQILTIAEGRMFTAEEYATRAKVCVIPRQVAGAAELGLGDRIDLSVYSTQGDLYDPNGWQPFDAGEYEIVGIFNGTEHNAYQIFLPDAAAVSRGVVPVTGYQLGTFRLKNDRVEGFLQAAEPLVERGFRVTVYDQGYTAATEPMRELLFLSILFLAVCLLLTVAAHGLQSHLFISRQRETAKTMDALGSGRTHVLFYFLGAALLLVLLSSVIGAGVAKLLEQRVFAALERFALQFADADLRFSDSRLSLVRTLAFAPETNGSVYALSVGLMLLGSALFTAIFALRALRDPGKTKKKRRSVLQHVSTRKAKSSRLSGVLKYAMLSIRRGVVRTVAVLLLCLIVAVFFGQLNASLDGYREQLQTYKEHAVIKGFATDMNGQLMDGLSVRGSLIRRLTQTNLLSSYTVSDALTHCLPIGFVEKADGTPCEAPIYEFPTSAFAQETLEYNIEKGYRIVNTSSVADSPLLHHAKVKDIEWADGYSDGDFYRLQQSIGALPRSVMEENGCQLGDTVRLIALYDGFSMIDVKIVASYASASVTPVLYMPILAVPKVVKTEQESGLFGDEDWYEEDEWYDEQKPEYAQPTDESADVPVFPKELLNRSIDSFLFTLRDTDDLDTLRNALNDAGFTYVHSGVRSHPFAIIEDEMYLNTTHSMERQIQYVSVLYNSLYAIAGVIGFVLAWLLTLSRRQEIAVMRAMGTQPIRILLNFSAEQLILSIVGLLLGVGLTALFGHLPNPMLWMLVGAFFAIWNLATLLCLCGGLLKQSYASLTEPD